MTERLSLHFGQQTATGGGGSQTPRLVAEGPVGWLRTGPAHQALFRASPVGPAQPWLSSEPALLGTSKEGA